MSEQHEVVLSDGTRLTRFPVGVAYGQVFLNFAARTEGEDFGEDGFSCLSHVRVEQNGKVLPFGGGGGGGTDKNWSDHVEFDCTDFEGSTIEIVYFDKSGELSRETLSLGPDLEWAAFATRRIRVMNDYGTDWPVWDREGGTVPGDFPDLSSSLVTDLLNWGRTFQEEYSHRSGWPDGFDHDAYFRKGRLLADRLQGELGDEFAVSFES